MKNISSEQAIETLEHAYELLDRSKDEERCRDLQEIIHIFRTKDIARAPLRQTSKVSLTYIPPGL